MRRRTAIRAIDHLLLGLLGWAVLGTSTWVTWEALTVVEQRRDERATRLALFEVVERTDHLERTLVGLGADPAMVRRATASARAERDPGRKLEHVDALIALVADVTDAVDAAPERQARAFEALRSVERLERAKRAFVEEHREWIEVSASPAGRVAMSLGLGRAP